MARYTIYSSNGQTARHTGAPTYHGIHLKVGYVEFKEIASPTLIPFAVGDYVDYTRTGFRYKLYSIPQPTKQAIATSNGDSFIYKDVQFHCATKDLEIAPFRDLVISDNIIHFTTLSNISTYEDVYGIARRVQANLDNFYGEGVWVIRVIDTQDAELLSLLHETKEFSVSDVTCIEVLSQINSQWKGIGWVYSVENGVNTITIGRPNVQDSGNTTSVFAYGIGNGISVLKKEQSDKNALATRIYAYGSTRNIINRYYNNISPAIKDHESVYIPNLMIPPGYWGLTDGQPDASKAFVEAASAIISKYGLRPKTIYFDGTGDYEEIYPSIEGVTAKDLRDEMQPTDEYYPSATFAPDSTRIDEVYAATNPTDDGTIGNTDGKKYKFVMGLAGVDVDQTTTLAYYQETAEINLGALTFSSNLTQTGKTTVTPQISGHISSSSAIGSAKMLVWFEIDGAKGAEHTVALSRDNQGRFIVEVKPFSENIRRTGSIVLKGKVIISPATPQGSFSVTTHLGVQSVLLEVEDEMSANFTVTVNQIGFDISKQASAISDGLCTISFKTGWCAGREFTVKKCVYSETNDKWVLTVARQNDESIGQYFPNSVYQIAHGDRFVLIDLTMPETYVLSAQVRLYNRALEVLSSMSSPKFTYEPEIDAKVLSRAPEKILEGMYMPIYDTDIVDGGTEWVLIDSIEIDELSEAIPTYKITLQDEKRESFLTRITKESGRNAHTITELTLRDLRTDVEELIPATVEEAELSVRVKTSNPFIGYDNSFDEEPLNEVVLTCTTTGIENPTYQWYYLGASGWIAIAGATAQTYTVDPDNASYFMDATVRLADFRCVVSGNENYADAIQISKMLTHTLSISLSNTSHVFQAGAKYAIPAEDRTSIICYMGVDRSKTRVDLRNIRFLDTDLSPMAVVYGGTRLSDVNGNLLTDAQGRYLIIGTSDQASMVDEDGNILMTVRVVNNNTANTYLVITTTDKLAEPTGVIEVPVVVREADAASGITQKVVNLYYSWALALAGNSAFTSTVFKRSEQKPAKPGNNQGDYLHPVPSGWSDGIPSGTATLWMTQRIFSESGEYPQQESWSDVTGAFDTADIDFEYSSLATDPGTPSRPSTGANWHDNANVNDIWMAVRKKTGGTWGEWDVMKVKGEKGGDGQDGADGTSVLAQYSSNGTSWHDAFVSGDIWMRTSNDSGATWGAAIRIVGEKGDPGNPGPYTDYSFAYSSQLTTANPQTAPSDVSTWYDAPPTPVDGKFLWMKVVEYTLNNGVLTPGQATYTRIGGEKGATGASGINQATIYLYKRILTTSTPAKPNRTLTYTFASGALSPTDSGASTYGNGWNREIPDDTVYPCYVTSVHLESRDAQKDIASADWSTPTRLVQNGADGQPGLNGKVMRGVNEFSSDGVGGVSGVEYQGLADTNTDDGHIYYDVIRWTNNKFYYCKHEFASDGTTRARLVNPTGSAESAYVWIEATHFDFIATNVLMAVVGYIDVLSSTGLYLYKGGEETNIVAGAQGGTGVNIFAGTDASKANIGAAITNALFRVYASGKVVAQNAEINGSIEASGNNFPVTEDEEGRSVAIKSNNGLWVTSGTTFIQTLITEGVAFFLRDILVNNGTIHATASASGREHYLTAVDGSKKGEVWVGNASGRAKITATDAANSVILDLLLGDAVLNRNNGGDESLVSSGTIKHLKTCTQSTYPQNPDADTLYIITE